MIKWPGPKDLNKAFLLIKKRQMLRMRKHPRGVISKVIEIPAGYPPTAFIIKINTKKLQGVIKEHKTCQFCRILVILIYIRIALNTFVPMLVNYAYTSWSR